MIGNTYHYNAPLPQTFRFAIGICPSCHDRQARLPADETGAPKEGRRCLPCMRLPEPKVEKPKAKRRVMELSPSRTPEYQRAYLREYRRKNGRKTRKQVQP